MNSKLTQIVEKKKESDEQLIWNFSVNSFQIREREKPIDIISSIKEDFFLIAEVKKRSPAKGIMREQFDHLLLAKEYEQAGASAVSVVTEENFFNGSKSYLSEIKTQVQIPCLRKDFIFHPAQVYQSYNLGADIILLIAAILEYDELSLLYEHTNELGMTALIEIHDENDLEKVLRIKPSIIGINNRNLNDFSVDLETSFGMKEMIPGNIHVISESGIRNGDDTNRLKAAGFAGALVGEAILKSDNIAETIRSLKNGED